MKKLLLTTLIATSCIFFSTAIWAEDKPDQDELQALFNDADLIKDGYIDKGEFDIYHFRSFNRIDADKDGILLVDECTGDCFMRDMWLGRGRADKAENHALAQTIRKYEFISTPYRFESIDKNGNGQLSIDEYIGFGRERFKYFDGNSNGMISDSEFCSGYHSSMPCDFSQNTGTESE